MISNFHMWKIKWYNIRVKVEIYNMSDLNDNFSCRNQSSFFALSYRHEDGKYQINTENRTEKIRCNQFYLRVLFKWIFHIFTVFSMEVFRSAGVLTECVKGDNKKMVIDINHVLVDTLSENSGGHKISIILMTIIGYTIWI